MTNAGGKTDTALSAAAHRLIDLVGEHPDGVTLTELTVAAQGRFTGLHPRRVADLVSRAVATGALVQAAGRLRVPGAREQEPEPARASGRPLRVIALDLEAVDEAHQLEDAATSALTTTVDYRTVEDLFSELTAWTDAARRSTERDAVREAVDNLELLLDHEQLPRVAGQAFDARGTGAGVFVGSRTVTLASAYAGSAGVGQVRTLTALLLRLAGQCEALFGTLSAYLAVHGPGLDFFEAERIRALLTRCARDVLRALRGEDTYFSPRTRRRVRLRTGLVNSRYFGANPAVRQVDVEDSLTRLQAAGRVLPVGPRWREAGHVRREARQQARTAVAATSPVAAGAGGAP